MSSEESMTKKNGVCGMQLINFKSNPQTYIFLFSHQERIFFQVERN